ncbi:MAG: efflux RND transporter permease subunit [Synergistota bacterium]|nr:efflux RND transporter permease subunit [Synergistota bacterium]
MNIAELCIKKKVVVLYMVVVVAIAGLISYSKLGKLEDPDFTIKTAVVTTIYPGATSQEVEQEVTDRVEEAIQKMGEIKMVRSLSKANLSIVYVDIRDEYTAGDLPQIWDVLRRKVNDVQENLPPGVQKSIVNDDYGDVYGQFYALVGDGYSYRELKDHADKLKKELLLVDGVGSVSIIGDQPEGIYVEISRSKMSAMGISPQDIYGALNQQNTLSPMAQVTVGNEYIRIDPTGAVKSVEDIGDVMIGGGPGGVIRLKDVAVVERKYVDPPQKIMRYDGRPALGIGISTVKGGNVVDMGLAVDARLRELVEITPVGMELEPIYLQASEVTTAVNGFVLNLIESLVIVVGVLVVFMGMRSGLLIGGILLLTIAATFATMLYMGITLQSVSLASLIIALGMLVDNAIVVTEGVLIGVQKGQGGPAAAAKTVAGNIWPLLGATVIAIMAFSAIGLSPDSTGEFCRSLFQVVGISLLWSWVLGITVTPLIAVMVLKDPEGEPDDPYKGKFFRVYRGFLFSALKNGRIFAVVMVVLFALALFGFRFVDKSFMPQDASPRFTVDLWRAEGADIYETSENMAKLEAYLLSRPDVESVATTVGGGTLRFTLTYTAEDPDSAYGQAVVNLKGSDTLFEAMKGAEDFVSKNLPGAVAQSRQFSKGGGSEAKIQIRFQGSNPAVLRSLAEQAEAVIAADPKAGFVRQDWRQLAKVIRPKVMTNQMRNMGLSRPQINEALMNSYQGDPIGVYREDNRLLTIYSRLPERERDGVEGLKLVQIWSPLTGKMVPLGSLVSGVETVFENPIVRRRDRERTLTVKADPIIGANSNALFERIRSGVEAIELPLGYSMEWGGEFESSSDAQKGIKRMLPLSLVVMLSIIVMLFNSIKQSAIIVACLPLCIIGVTVGLLLFGKSFSFMALLGVLSLIGMLIKNAIVLIDQVNINLEDGMIPFDAVMDSGVSRLRPVMMAAGTTILGMIPLIRDVLFGPMAVTIMCGLGFATVLTLLFVPVLFVLFYGIDVPEGDR